MSDAISYLGPAGTFTEQALRLAPQAQGHPWKPVANVAAAIADVAAGASCAAMIAIENSIEGGVTASQDALATTPNLRIIGEYIVPVRFNLVARRGTSLVKVHTIAAHPVAYGQCRNWLHANLPAHRHLIAASNIASVDLLDTAEAAIVPTHARFDLDVLAENIHDNASARTRFVLVSTQPGVPARTGSDKTSLIVELPEERPGGLMTMLEQFAARGVNLSMITSRPIPEQPGRYRFVVDLDGHIEDARVADALLGLRRYCPAVKFLGSYPRAEASRVAVDDAASEARYQQARAWLDGLTAS